MLIILKFDLGTYGDLQTVKEQVAELNKKLDKFFFFSAVPTKYSAPILSALFLLLDFLSLHPDQIFKMLKLIFIKIKHFFLIFTIMEWRQISF